MKCTPLYAGLLLAPLCLASTTALLFAQEAEKSTDSAKISNQSRYEAASVDRTYKLRYTQSQADQNEVLTSLRNMLNPQTKIFLVPSNSVIAIHAPEEDQARVSKLLATLDLPHPVYRVTYTVTELEGTHKIGVQHFSMLASVGQPTVLKQGSRLPIYSGTQYTYYDVGINFDATLLQSESGVTLKSKVEQTGIAPDSLTTNNSAPIIRQTLLEGTTFLAPNKPAVLGSLDVPGSTRHFDVEVVLQPIS